MNKYYLFIFLFFFMTFDLQSQCSMLSAIMETDQGYESAKGLNRGIIYLMSIPYILIGLIIWKIYKTNKAG